MRTAYENAVLDDPDTCPKCGAQLLHLDGNSSENTTIIYDLECMICTWSGRIGFVAKWVTEDDK